MSNHTASPWSISDDGAGHYWIEGAVPGEAIIADLVPREPLAEPTEEDWANAYLIASAPFMREVLEKGIAGWNDVEFACRTMARDATLQAPEREMWLNRAERCAAFRELAVNTLAVVRGEGDR